MSDILTCRESVARLLRRSGLGAGYVANLSGRIERCRTIHGIECLLAAEVEAHRWLQSTMPRARVCRAALALIERHVTEVAERNLVAAIDEMEGMR